MKAGWMDVYGNLFPLKCCSHNEDAKILLADHYKLDLKLSLIEVTTLYGYGASMTDLLEHYGWIRLHLFSSGKSQWLLIDETALTPSQKASILEWCIKYKVKYEDAIKLINYKFL